MKYLLSLYKASHIINESFKPINCQISPMLAIFDSDFFPNRRRMLGEVTARLFAPCRQSSSFVKIIPGPTLAMFSSQMSVFFVIVWSPVNEIHCKVVSRVKLDLAVKELVHCDVTVSM